MAKDSGYRARLILNRVKEDESGTKYLEFAKYRIYYDLDIDPKDYHGFMSGIIDLLKESFLYPPPYFSSNFRPKCGDTVFDIGANIGTITVIMSKMVGDSGRVYSFEPATFRSLQKNITANHLENCRVVPKAVSNLNGQIEIRILDITKESNIIEKNPGGQHYGTKMVESIMLDSFVESNAIERVDFITMDIEGAEELAILGARRMIERYHPQWSIASYHRDRENELQHPKLVKLLRSFGYQIEETGSTHIFAH
ncbi:MAG: FkbM family methyltransferase [Methanomassiliicoccales archaeon]|jgi:FkbM family methyltransferase